MGIRTALAWMVMAGSVTGVLADDVVLKNGDSLTGTITRIDGGQVEVVTDFAGTIQVKRDRVKALRSEGLVVVADEEKEHKAFVVPSEDWAGWHEAEARVAGVAVPARKPLVTPIALPRQNGAVVIGYLGSSTWAMNQGSGQVPTLIEGQLKAAHPGATLTTVNGAIGGTGVESYMPGQRDSNKLKAAMQAQKGFKVLRLMIGSNDAAAGMTTAAWLSRMNRIVKDAQAWPVDVIVLEEIGVRTDKGEAGIKLVREYNEARKALLRPQVVLGTAHTLQNEMDHMETLGKDHIHQTEAGQVLLAGVQAAEMEGLFAEKGGAAGTQAGK